jgi:hypothetical protein
LKYLIAALNEQARLPTDEPHIDQAVRASSAGRRPTADPAAVQNAILVTIITSRAWWLPQCARHRTGDGRP